MEQAEKSGQRIVGKAKPGKRIVRMVRGPHCPRCDHELVPAQLLIGIQTCLACAKPFDGIPCQPPPPVIRRADAADGETTECVHHEGNLAVDACGRCGSFICSLCKMETDELVLCPSCLERMTDGDELASMRRELVNYGYLALSVALGNILLFPIGLIGAVVTWLYVRKNVLQNRRLGERLGATQAFIAWILAMLSALGCVGFWLAILLKGK